MSDRHYFAWSKDALERFERESGEFAATGAGHHVDFWVLAGARMNPAIELVRDALGRKRTTVRLLDRFAGSADVIAADLNALGDMPDDACDVLMMTRASYLIEDPSAFLRDARRILRPDGLLVIDWVHGAAEAPALDLPEQHEYDGHAYPFRTTYCDAESLVEFAGEFQALIRHINRPSIGARVRRLLEAAPRAEVTLATYLDTLRGRLEQAGKHLVEPGMLAPSFKVLFRDACYLHPLTKRFYLYLLTVLRPVGKS